MKWFKQYGWIYLPIHFAGYVIILLAITFMIPICMAAFSNTHSISDCLYQVFVYATCVAFWYKWIAEKKL